MSIEDNQSLKITKGVLSFDDNTLFLRQKDQGQRQFDFLIGKSKVTATNTNNFIKNISKNHKFCEENKINYAHAIFPCKAVAYRKKFAEIGIEINPIASSKHLSHQRVFYPKINNIKEDWYHKTDTHCSYIGYLNILRNLFRIVDMEFPKLEIVIGKRLITGDLGKMCNAKDVEVDYIKGFGNNAIVHKFSNIEALPGTSGEIYFTVNDEPIIKKRLLLFGDSFFEGCLDILSNIFEEVCYIRNPFIMQDVALLLKPDIVFTGCAERYLTKVEYYKNTSPFFINYFKHNASFEKLNNMTLEAFKCFFSSRDSHEYLLWRRKLGFKKLLKLTDKELLALAKCDSLLLEYIRDTAISLEEHSLNEAYRLMSIAQVVRPLGPVILKKLTYYKTLLNQTDI
ncbi:hypothetical protein FQP81_17675 [Pseudoalteromonas distincta]|uniref:hypothetical protein n=1 Tax=Pseudoalteromonas distincta TaxID=77608 RepID=UPI00118ED08E|nr:hypothetical protein [Pseudoalteromonas elyakovii]TVU70809.1 hypothetical protein FQP81_17675 [Pseudoalteromonas elyakovii]|tara:strand:+ start:349 stop:1539 length:1191 start_codon:yes stop_codon:yes gene_type:complete